MKFWSWALECVVLGMLTGLVMFALLSIKAEITVWILLALASFKIVDFLSIFTKFIFNRMGNDDYEDVEDRKQS